jgi:NADH:ubiquinone oxidoreductase subunit 3 (subunit A)
MHFSDFTLFCFFLPFNFFIAFLLVIISRFLAKQYKNREKLSSYECGFDPFEDTRISFNIHYFLISILFIIFDVEIIVLFPIVLSFSITSLFSFIYIYFFLFLLTLGFLLELIQKTIR